MNGFFGSFKALAESNLSSLLEVFTPDVEIHNVNLPVYKGVKGVQEYSENFQGRIAHAEFDILVMLEKESLVLAEWEAKLTYRQGARVGEFLVKQPFEVALRGVNVFRFAGDKIKELRIYHETTTVTELARQHAKP